LLLNGPKYLKLHPNSRVTRTVLDGKGLAAVGDEMEEVMVSFLKKVSELTNILSHMVLTLNACIIWASEKALRL